MKTKESKRFSLVESDSNVIAACKSLLLSFVCNKLNDILFNKLMPFFWFVVDGQVCAAVSLSAQVARSIDSCFQNSNLH